MLRPAAALCAMLFAAVTACGNDGVVHDLAAPPTSVGPPLTVKSSSDAKPAVSGGRLTRTLLLDSGKLRLDPTSAVPRLSEDTAVRLWAAGGSAGSLVDTEQAVVVLAKVTLAVPVTASGGPQPATMPAFAGRDAWVMLWQNGPHSCPMITAGASGPGGPEPQPVEILAADGSGAGVSYATRGSFCMQPLQGPTATIATYQESLPWTVASSTPTSVTLSYTVPACAVQSGLAGPNGSSYTIWVGATVAMGTGPCLGAKPGPATATVRREVGTEPTHGATGLLVTRSSGDFKTLTYFDGQTRSLPVSQ